MARVDVRLVVKNRTRGSPWQSRRPRSRSPHALAEICIRMSGRPSATRVLRRTCCRRHHLRHHRRERSRRRGEPTGAMAAGANCSCSGHSGRRPPRGFVEGRSRRRAIGGGFPNRDEQIRSARWSSITRMKTAASSLSRRTLPESATEIPQLYAPVRHRHVAQRLRTSPGSSVSQRATGRRRSDGQRRARRGHLCGSL